MSDPFFDEDLENLFDDMFATGAGTPATGVPATGVPILTTSVPAFPVDTLNSQAFSSASAILDHNTAHFHDGTDCPACGQTVRLRRRPLSKSMAIFLKELATLALSQPGDPWVRYTDLPCMQGNTRSRDYSTTLSFGLSERKPLDASDKTKSDSGYWRLTEKGWLFVRGLLQIPSHAYTYNRMTLALDGRKLITFSEALRQPFDFEALMASIPPISKTP